MMTILGYCLSIIESNSECGASVTSSETTSGEAAAPSTEAFITDTEMPSRLLIRSQTFCQTQGGGSTEVTSGSG